MLRVGLVGAGFMGEMHSACYAALGTETVRVTGVADLNAANAKKIADSHHATAFSDPLELIASPEIDAVDLCLPTHLHATYARAAMESGKAVFIEKPVCRTADEADELLLLQEKTGVPVMVVHCIRMWPEYQWLKNAMERNSFGPLETLVLKRVSPRPEWAWNNWLHDQKLSGGVALDMHIHDVDFMRYLLGDPKSLSSVISCARSGEMNQIFTNYSYDHTAVSIEACWDYPSTFPFCMEYRAKFCEATVVYRSQDNSFLVYQGDETSFQPTLDVAEVGENAAGGNVSSLAGYYHELSYFVDRVSSKESIQMSTLQDAADSLKLTLEEITQAKIINSCI